MDETVENKLMLDALDHALEIYGGDAARWPEGTRLRLQPFLAVNSEAQNRMAAARALDLVLGFAPRLSDAQNAALAGRIVAKAARQPRVVTGVAKPQPAPSWYRGLTSQGFAGAALAASLVLGIYAGQSADLGSWTEATSAIGQQMAQSDEADTLLDEDLL